MWDINGNIYHVETLLKHSIWKLLLVELHAHSCAFCRGAPTQGDTRNTVIPLLGKRLVLHDIVCHISDQSTEEKKYKAPPPYSASDRSK